MRRFTSIFIKRDKNSDLSSSSSSTNGDHSPTPSWKSWIGAKRSSQKRHPLPLADVIDEDSPSEEEEGEEVDEDDEDDQNNIRIRIQNALTVHPQPNSPFGHHPDLPIFPRSTNRPSILKPQSSTRIAMFNSHLLARLNSFDLSPFELSTLLPFASKSAPSPITHPILPSSDICHPKNSYQISSASLGIQRWITRPCFEERFSVYLPTDSGIQCHPVSSSVAVAALEYTEYLDVMVDPDFDQSSDNLNNVFYHAPPDDPSNSVPAIQSQGSPPETPVVTPAPVHWRNSSTAVPSPLRIQHTPPQPTTAFPKEVMPAVVTPPPPKSTVKRIVRFVEDDEDDGIPLHMVRIKKKREQKAKFLQLEQLKRAKEEGEAQKLQEQEALERERKRLAKEKEKREMDKALYADVIAAARIRQEGHRVGIIPSNTTHSSDPLVSSSSLGISERNKPLTDSRKFASSDSTPTLSIPRRDNSDSSPGGSQSPSTSHSPVSPGHFSRPPSMYSASSSSEEVWQQRGSRRNSVTLAAAASVSGGPSSYHRPPLVPSYPSWTGSSSPLPDLMPLLPPAAPFMKGSSHNRGSSPGSSASSSRRDSFNSSNHRVNQPLLPQTTGTSSASSRHHSSTTVPSLSRTKPGGRPTHERRSTGDSRTVSTHATQHQQRPTPTHSRSQPVMSRGRPALPSSLQYLQTPSPWPASQNGLVPMPMAIPMQMGYNSMNAYPVMLNPSGPMPTMQGMQLGGVGRDA